jgi:Tol biopolymer transport system component
MTGSMRTILCAALLLPAVGSAQRAAGPAPARDPMQEGLPLQPTRTLTFTTTVGHWMSADVSSDGTMLVFDLLGDIYTMPITGGKATPLTRGMAFDAQPRFSPDGKKVVFVTDRTGGYNLWIISVDKKDTVQVTTGNAQTYESPIWTPDGKYIIAARGGAKLWMFPASGGTGVQFIRDSAATAGTRETGPAIGKDPRYVYFAQRRGRFVYNSPLSDYRLMAYDRQTGALSTKEVRWGSAFRPTLSPDGTWLVYDSTEGREDPTDPTFRTTLWRMDADGSNALRIGLCFVPPALSSPRPIGISRLLPFAIPILIVFPAMLT